MEGTADWTYKDFLCYLLLMGAYADLGISEREREAIVEKVGEEHFVKIKRCYESQNDAQHIETVSELYKRFESEIGGKDNLVKALKEVIAADNRPEHVMDRYLMMMLKRY